MKCTGIHRYTSVYIGIHRCTLVYIGIPYTESDYVYHMNAVSMIGNMFRS